MSYKTRILFVGEASCLSTGFATYYRELIPRLVATGKYEIAELGSYVRQDDPKAINFVAGRWKFYGVVPTNEAENQVFGQSSQNPRDKGQNINQFGAWKFDAAVADFKPDLVIDIRDNWMLTWQLRSPFRKWFKLVWMPTVDAEPQHEEWINDYEQADIVLSYSDYGINALLRQSQKIRVFPRPMRPGVDINGFKPEDREMIRGKYGIKTDVPIIGTVMRNQSRKLYPDLIDAFALMKKKFQGESIVDKAVLMLHSCWPDNMFSYDYPRHIMRLNTYSWMPNYFKGLKNHVLQTFMCHNKDCRKTHVGYAMAIYGRPIQQGVVPMPCPHCGQNTSTCPTTGQGFDREQLSEVYNLMDLYVQCSICEGDGMPIQEAKACGVPTLVMDYTAMREKGRFPKEYSHFTKHKITEESYGAHKGGEVIKVGRYYYEPETSCMRALPDISDMAQKMRDILTDKEKHNQMKIDARKCAEDVYDWDKLYKQWEFLIDNMKIKDRSQTWDSPIIVHEDVKPPLAPDGLTDDKFVEWLYLNIMKYPSVDVSGAQMWIHHLKNGVTRQQIYDQFVTISRQQENDDNSRQKIRVQMAIAKGEAVATPDKPRMEFV